MWPFSRWFKPQQARPPIAPPQAPAPAPIIRASERRSAPAVPPEALGLERIESRSHPGRYYYRNAIPPPLPGLPCIHGDAFFTYEVAGASYYQETLERIVGGRRSASVYFRAIAVLASEPENPYYTPPEDRTPFRVHAASGLPVMVHLKGLARVRLKYAMKASMR
ncbi:MAG: hypothetical protein ABSC25_22460, partial [Roseiarcus sp.]